MRIVHLESFKSVIVFVVISVQFAKKVFFAGCANCQKEGHLYQKIVSRNTVLYVLIPKAMYGGGDEGRILRIKGMEKEIS